MGEVVREATRRADELIAGLLLLARSEAPSAVDPAAVRTGRPRRPRRARARRDARPRPPGAGCGCASTARPRRRWATRCCSSGWPGTSWRTRCGTTSRRAGWRSAPGCGAPSAELYVSSGGPEIAPERVEELFEPFRRGPVDRTADTPGSGLGLSIVRAVVHAHGGTVAAEPVPGGGLTVVVRLPGTRRRAARPCGHLRLALANVPTRAGEGADSRTCVAGEGRSGDGAGEVGEHGSDQLDLPLARAALAQRRGDRRRPRAGTSRRGAGGRAAAGSPPGSTTPPRAPRCPPGRPRAARRRPGRGRPSARRAGARRPGPSPSGSSSGSRRAACASAAYQ